MRKTRIVFSALATAALGACAIDQDAGDAISTNLPPAPPATPTPPAIPPTPIIPVPAAPGPIYAAKFPSLPEPPVLPLVCNPCSKIAFQSWTDSDIYSVNADGTGLTRLASIASFDSYPTWSPDGSRVAYATRSEDPTFELFVVNADGSNVGRIYSPVSHELDWSPDGTRVAYASYGSIMLISANGGIPVTLYSSTDYLSSPTWSPDGTQLAFERIWDPRGDSDIYVINNDGSGVRPLTDTNPSDGIGYQSPSWSPDGTKIAMNIHYYLNFNTHQIVVGTINVNGTGLTPIIAGIADWNRSSNPTWSPDGTMIAFESGSYEGQVDVSWVKADGSARGTIVTNGLRPDWQR